MIAVEGEVFLGDAPLEAELWFGGRYGNRRLHTRSDEDGKYRIHLPQAGKWATAIQSDSPKVTRTLRDVDVPESGDTEPVVVNLRIPDTRIFGKVSDEGMFPVADAIVTVIDYDRLERPASTRTDDSGSFEFVGLGPGELQVFAVAGDLRSEEEIVSLDEDRAQRRLLLTLQKGDRITGTLTSPIGPVPGAMLALVPEGNPNGHQKATDVRGQFTVRVPPGTTAIDFVALPPGHPLTVGRGLIQEGKVRLETAYQSGSLLIPGGIGALAKTAQPGGSLVIFREGVMIELGLLAEWQGMQQSLGHDVGDAELSILPNIAAGGYKACILRREERLRFVVNGTHPTRCSSTFVPVGGEGFLDPARLREEN